MDSRDPSAYRSRRCVSFALVWEILLGVGFFVTSLVTSSACYLVVEATGECVQGAAKSIFAISRGQDFHMLASGLLFVIHGIWAWKVLRNGTSALNIGVCLGSGLLVSIVAITTAGLWGSLSATMDALDCADSSKLPQVDSTTHLKCNNFSNPFSALTVLASLIFISSGASTSMLFFWLDDFVEHSGNSAGHAYAASEYENLNNAEGGADIPDPIPGGFLNLSASRAAP